MVTLLDRAIRSIQGERPGMSAGFYTGTSEQRDAALVDTSRSILIEQSVRFVDVSFWQGTIDFSLMKSAGALGAIIRAGQRSWVDSRFRENWTKAKAAGLPRGSYWFYDSREDPKKQAELWWTQLQSDPGELVFVADLEESYGGPYGKVEHFKQFISRFIELAKVSDHRIIIYTGYFWWRDRVGNDPWFKRFRLWIAWYSAMSVVRVPAPWAETDVFGWQYTSSGPGNLYGVSSAEIDLNWYCCSVTKWSLDFQVDVPDPIDQGEKIMKKGTVRSNVTRGLNIREVGSNNVVGALFYDTELQKGDSVIGEVKEDNRIYFTKITRANGLEETLPLLSSAIVQDNVGVYMDLVEWVEKEVEITIPDIPVTITLGDDITFEKQIIQVVLKPKL